jgi:hypothetical protein
MGAGCWSVIFLRLASRPSLAGPQRLVTTSHNQLATFRALKMLGVHVCSLARRNAVSTVWAGGVQHLESIRKKRRLDKKNRREIGRQPK